MAYRAYLGDALLPVPPGKLTVKVKNQNKTVTLINEGEINMLKTPGLTDISMDLLLPAVPYPFAQYASGFQPPDFYLSLFEKIKTQNQTPQFILTRMFPNGRLSHVTNIKVSVEDYSIVDDDGNGFDTTVSLNLKQWRDYGVKIVQIAANPAPPEPQRPVTTTGDWKVGSIVYFTGSDHYSNSNAASPNNPKSGLKAGYAKITQTNPGSKHPWHLIHTSNGGSNVYGWVNTGTFE